MGGRPSLSDPGSALQYFLVVLGSPLAGHARAALWVGLLLVLLGAYVYAVRLGALSTHASIARQDATRDSTTKRAGPIRQARVTGFSVWDSLVLFAFLSTLILVVVRAGFGMAQGFDSRYTTLTILGIVGLYVISLGTMSQRGKRAAVAFGLPLSLIGQGVFVSLAKGIESGRSTRASRLAEVRLLRSLASHDDVTVGRTLYPRPSVLRQLAQVPESRRMNLFQLPTCGGVALLTLRGLQPCSGDE